MNVATSSEPEPVGIAFLRDRQYRTFSTAYGVEVTYSSWALPTAPPPTCTLQVKRPGSARWPGGQ